MSIGAITNFLMVAPQYGMPTRFLWQVLGEYDVIFKSGREGGLVKQSSNEMFLYEDVIDALRIPGLAGPSGVQTLYHESTHAYFDLVDYGETAVFKDAERYYKGALLASGARVRDTERAVDEAAGSYVGHRAITVWLAWQRLENLTTYQTRLVNKGVTVDYVLEKLSKDHSIPEQYNEEMRERVFGYVGDQDNIKGPIHAKLKAYCDQTILENAIYDNFYQMALLKWRFEMVLESLRQFPAVHEAVKNGNRGRYTGVKWKAARTPGF